MMQAQDILEIGSLDLEGQGVARRDDGKVVFVEGALPGERVTVEVTRRKNQWEQAQLREVVRESAQRVTPRCPHFGLHAGACGGCKMQHLHPAAQVAVKQRVLEDNLWHLGKVKAQRMLRPIEGPAWGYRQRARLSVRHVHKKGQVLVGFHERKSRYVADMKTCPVLAPRVDAMLMPLRELVAGMDQRDRVPQIEVAVGDEVVALVLRHLEPLSAADAHRLADFAAAHDVQWWLQPAGPDSVHRLDVAGREALELAYRLPAFDVRMPFLPTDFTQVNLQINRVLVSRALGLLAPEPSDRVIDWFCGLGNFTLPLARRSSEVLGLEGSATLVERARANAVANGLGASTSFAVRNLFEIDADTLWALGRADRWLVDPPREGAFALVKALVAAVRGPQWAEDPSSADGASPEKAFGESGQVPHAAWMLPGDWQPPRRIVYVSCNPATLARDAGLLVHRAGYRCSAAGVVNMFPHTAHVESMAVFDFEG
jgi:23S rRNA (uracil1939-C5)-methyltransferase